MSEESSLSSRQSQEMETPPSYVALMYGVVLPQTAGQQLQVEHVALPAWVNLK